MNFQIPWVRPAFSGREKQFVLEALESAWISGGPFVNRLEKDLAENLSVPSAVCVSNGTTALHLALLAAGIGPGDEVIVPNFTFVAPGNMVLAVGATPVFADIDSDTWCLDPRAVERMLTPQTKAVIAVHIYGNTCLMDQLRRLTTNRGIILIEDAAEAFMSKYHDVPVGTWGDFGTFSFHATKTLTTGEGGLVVAKNVAMIEKMRVIRDHGMLANKRYWHTAIGYNFRMTNLQAAIGCAQLEALPAAIKARAELWTWYQSELAQVQGVRIQNITPGADPVMWTLGLFLDSKVFPDRDRVITQLAEAGIETRPGFYPFSVQPPYQQYKVDAANAVYCAKHILALPFYVGMTQVQVSYISRILQSVGV